MDVKAAIDEYYKLKKQRDMITSRLDRLGERIKKSLLITPSHELDGSDIKAKLQIRQSRPNYDQFLLTDLLERKGLDDCFKKVPDEDLVEQAWLNDLITDDDLRSIGAAPKVTLALTFEEVGDEDIQESDESLCEGPR